MRYSIWIIPPEPVFSELGTTIHSLAAEYGGPVFEPHITILGSVDGELKQINRAVDSAIQNLGRLTLALGPISFGTTYYQSVLARVESTAQLLQLNLNIKKQLGLENNAYHPHVSLIYGDHDMTIREEIAAKVKLTNAAFIAETIAVVEDTPDPSEWSAAASFHLR